MTEERQTAVVQNWKKKNGRRKKNANTFSTLKLFLLLLQLGRHRLSGDVDTALVRLDACSSSMRASRPTDVTYVRK